MRKGGQDTKRISRTGKEEESCSSLEGELSRYEELGIALYLDGHPSDASAIAKACQIADGGGYMRDYTEDEMGRIARVDFDFVIDESPGRQL